MMKRALHGLCITAFALGAMTCLAPPAFAAAATELIRSLQLVAAPAPVKQRHDWRVPHKVLLLEFGRQDWAPRQAQFASAAPHTQVIVVHNMAEALAQAPGTDVLVGFNPEICEPRLLRAATDLRWIESLAAGVENCLAVPGLRGVAGPGCECGSERRQGRRAGGVSLWSAGKTRARPGATR